MSNLRPYNRPSPAAETAWPRFGPLLVVGLLFALVWLAGAAQLLSPERLWAGHDAMVEWVAGNRAAAIVGFFVLYAGFAALSIPGGALLSVLAGFLFGAWTGGLIAVLAATSGAALLFIAVRAGLADSLRERAGPRLSKLRDGFHADAVSYMLFLRLTPAFPFWFVNLASAALGVEWRIFFWTTLVGIMPATFAFAFAGVGLESLLAAQHAAFEACVASGGKACTMRLALSDFVTREFFVGLAALGALALLPVVLRFWRRKSAAGEFS
jgi:uncharacterized membrane protein YdjX (TVP38/TMEM64 family)